MATAAQISANQQNAKLSTGPRTPEGKAASSNNARKHGLTSTRLIVRPDELEEFDSLRLALLAELQPQGALENLTFDQLLRSAWNIERTHRLEFDLMANGLDPLLDASIAEDLNRILRYRSAAERSYWRAVKELRTLQTERALRTFKLTQEDQANMPALASTNQVTKQTRSEVTAEALGLALKMADFEGHIGRLPSLYQELQNEPEIPSSQDGLGPL